MNSGIDQPLVVGKQPKHQTELEISLLGSFKLHKIGHGEIKENRRKSQALLAWLLLESDQIHTREQLIILLWPEMDRSSGLKNLRVTLSRLRKQLAEPAALETTRLDVKLHPSQNHRVDVVQFETLISETERHLHQRLATCNDCIAKLKKALTYYRGPFLAGLNLDVEGGFEEWLFVWRERLFLQLIDLLDKLANAYMDRGEYDQSLVYTRRQLELDSLYDRAQKRLLRLLALQKNVPAALNQFKQLELRLKMEMGVEPDKEMRQLVADIQSGRLDTLGVTQANEGSLSKKKLGNLPENLTPFFGREPEIDQLSAKLKQPDYRLISIVGPGGIGKSRLSLEVARNNQARFGDGAFFVPLAPLTRVDQIPAAVGHVIGCQFHSSTVAVEDQLIEFLTDKTILLVIDNFEHLFSGIDLLLKILRRCPKVVLLVTSRRMLDAQAEDLFQLEGLPFPNKGNDKELIDQFPAVGLFCNRARRLLKSFRLTAENEGSVTEICRLTEGLPLALELAAGWIRDIPLPDLVSAIKQSQSILQTSSRDIAPQHRSIQAVFEYSWQLLSNGEQQLLAALSIFRGGFTAKAISEITGATPIDLIRLCNHSLVRRIAGSGRYQLHELTRQFAAGKLAQDLAKQAEITKKHASYYLDLLIAESVPLIHTEPIIAFQRLQANFDNIRIAWENGFNHQLWNQLPEAIQGFINYHIRSGSSRGAIDILKDNLIFVEKQQKSKKIDFLKASLLTYKGYLLARLVDKEAKDAIEQSLSFSKAIGDPYLLTFNYFLRGKERNGKDDIPIALVFLRQAAVLAREYRFLDLLMFILRVQGHSNLLIGNYDLAEQQCQEAVDLGQKHNLYPEIQVQALGEIGNVAGELGRLEEGSVYLKHALAMQEKSGNPRDRALLHHHLASIQIKLGLSTEAIQNMGICLQLCLDIGDHYLKNWARYGLAEALRKNGQSVEAIQALEPALLDVGRFLHIREAGLIMLELGNCYEALGEWEKAGKMFEEAIENFKENGYINEIVLAQSGLAFIRLQERDFSKAFELVNPIVEKLEKEDTTGWDNRLRPYFHCCVVLKSVKDKRASNLILKSQAVLDEVLSKIESQELRLAMIENIPAHREIIALASQI